MATDGPPDAPARLEDGGHHQEDDPRFEIAAAAPGRVFWRRLSEGTEWRDEAAFEALRRTSTAQESSAGRYAEPVHRPAPR